MELNKINQSDYLDIIFEYRNKAYGAYELRKGYQKTVKRAIFFGGILFLAALLVPFYAFTHKLLDKTTATIPNRVFKYPPIKEEIKKPKTELPKLESPKKIETPPPAVKAVIFKPPVVIEDKYVVSTPPQIEDFKDAVAAQTANNTGEKGNGAAPTTLADGNGKTAIAAPVIVETPAKPEAPIAVVEVRPQFPGGELALMQWLADNIKYPAMAREINVEGKVFLSFVVEKDGSITDIKVRRGIGSGCDDEAKRAVGAMPRWSPGKQNGRLVRVQYTLPVQFKLEQ